MKYMKGDVASHLNEEACGLLAGKNNHVQCAIAIKNVLNSPILFRMDPQGQIDAFRYFEQQGWELLGIYHSHPKGPDYPSLTDIEEAYYPEVFHLIWSCQNQAWRCKGYLIREGRVYDVAMVIQD